MEISYQYVTGEDQRELVALRREFHQYPEEGFTEYRTSGRIAQLLASYGYQVTVGPTTCSPTERMGLPTGAVLSQCEQRAKEEKTDPTLLEKMHGGQTGVVGVLKGERPGPVTALRFDIDALPIPEETGLPFASAHPGVMHACGHDGHISVGLMVAKGLARHRKELAGEVRLLFQPAEEGCRGARAMVAGGWLKGVDRFLSGHIGLTCRKLGQIYACASGFLATSKWNITFRGQSAHAGKEPEKGRNALLAAAVFTQNAYAISRTSQGDTRINVGKFISGTGRNIIADEAYLEVETRGSTTQANAYMEEAMKQVAQGAAQIYQVTVTVEQVGGAGSGQSSPELAEELRRPAQAMGPEIDYRTDGRMTASEDVVTMMQAVQAQGGQAAYYLFGSGLAAEHHQRKFDFQEQVLPLMTEFYLRAVLDCGEGAE